MARDPGIRRLTLVRAGEDETIRRYRLARLDEVALASPPYSTDPERPEEPAEPPAQSDEPAAD